MSGTAGFVFALLAALPSPPPHLVEGESFTIPLPDGYRDVSELVRRNGFPGKQITLEANDVSLGYQPTINIRLVSLWGGTLGNAALCKQSAASIAGPTGRVKSWALIDGPAPSGKVCQMHVVRPEGIALMTELISPAETWLMVCNHADGDAAAEKVCRATLAAFRFKKPPPVAPKIAFPRVGVPECDDYLDKFVACVSRRSGDGSVWLERLIVKLMAEGWRAAAASKETRKTLPASCTKALAQTKAILAPTAGCEW